MLTKILRKDLKNRKGVNIILFLFILLATVFLSSSLNNIFSVSNGISYYQKYANIPDLTLTMNGLDERKSMEEFLNSQKTVKDYEYAQLVPVSEEELSVVKNSISSEYDSGGVAIYLGDNIGKPEGYSCSYKKT